MKLFTASWCAPCKVVKEELTKYNHTVEVVDIDENPGLVRACNVRSVPSLVLGNGEVVTSSSSILKVIREAYVKAD